MPWHLRPRQCPVLLCLPPAGAGCGQFRPWQDALGAAVSVIGVQLPGRETRWADPAAETVDEVVGSVVAELVELVPRQQPIVLFGHSFGGLLGYEITRRLGLEHGRWPAALVVAACRPPHWWIGAGRGLVDDELELRELLADRSLDPDELDEDSQELALEMLRQDARLSLSYIDPGRTPVACPLQAWGGEQDKTIRPEHLSDWHDYAAGDFQQRQFPGGHYFYLDRVDAVLNLLGRLAAEAERVSLRSGGQGAGRSH